MPAQHRLRRHDEEVVLPIPKHLGQQNPKHPVTVVDPGASGGPLQNDDLLPEGQVLESQPRPICGEELDQGEEPFGEIRDVTRVSPEGIPRKQAEGSPGPRREPGSPDRTARR